MLLLDATRAEYQLPRDCAIRVSGVPTPDGDIGLHVAFADEPDEGDLVDHQHGTTVYVAPEVAESLAQTELELDVAVVVSNNGSAPASFVIRPHPDGS